MKWHKYLAPIIACIMIFTSLYVDTTPLVISAYADSVKLSAPTGFKADVTSDTIVIRWNKISGADAYRVYKYNPLNNKYEPYKDVVNNRCRVHGLSVNTKYKFKVAALVKNEDKFIVQKKAKVSVKTAKQTVTNDESIAQSVADQIELENADGSLRIHFIDVGQGDSTFIELPNGQTMLIDAGEIDQGDKVVAYIYEHGYDTINYVVATHAHSDHIGGLPYVLDNFNVDAVIMTSDKSDTQIFTHLFTAIYLNGADLRYVLAGDVLIKEDQLLVEVVAPKDLFDNDHNNNSVVIKLTYGNNKFLFAGDAEKAEEAAIRTNIKCDLLKVGHHGGKTSSSYNFLKKVNPKFAIISCGLDNKYGHPTNAVLNRLKKRKIKLFRTDLQGTIIVESDGNTISIDKTPFDYTQNTTTPSAVSDNNDPSQEITYVLNVKTQRIHYPWCPSVEETKSKNKKYTTDYNAAIEEGFKPCGRCNPKG